VKCRFSTANGEGGTCGTGSDFRSETTAIYEPHYDIDLQTGTSIGGFCVSHVLARSIWCTRSWLAVDMPERLLARRHSAGPSESSYLTYRDIATPPSFITPSIEEVRPSGNPRLGGLGK